MIARRQSWSCVIILCCEEPQRKMGPIPPFCHSQRYPRVSWFSMYFCDLYRLQFLSRRTGGESKKQARFTTWSFSNGTGNEVSAKRKEYVPGMSG